MEGPVFRPPSEASSFILQATVGCSWNHCTYCVMYRHKTYRIRSVEECLEEIRLMSSSPVGSSVDKVFVADGDALSLETRPWLILLDACRRSFPRFRRASCYATAFNLLQKSQDELVALREAGLSLLYLGPESGDDITLRAIAKGANAADHVEAARRARAAGMSLSLIFLLGIAGEDRSQIHAEASAELATAMDPAYLNALTLTVLPFAPIARLQARGTFRLPSVDRLLLELRTMVEKTNPTHALFRSNHASNYLALAGRLPRDRARLLNEIDGALAGERSLRQEWERGL